VSVKNRVIATVTGKSYVTAGDHDRAMVENVIQPVEAHITAKLLSVIEEQELKHSIEDALNEKLDEVLYPDTRTMHFPAPETPAERIAAIDEANGVYDKVVLPEEPWDALVKAEVAEGLYDSSVLPAATMTITPAEANERLRAMGIEAVVVEAPKPNSRLKAAADRYNQMQSVQASHDVLAAYELGMSVQAYRHWKQAIERLEARIDSVSNFAPNQFQQ
jgi:hypothetical protein